MTTEPYASARRVFWVVDNGSSHNGATLVHLPVHASWLNEVEMYFSIPQRKAINPNEFTHLGQFSERIIGFQDRYNTTATPFDWTYIRDDLNAFLHRLELDDTPNTRAHAACPSDELTTVTTSGRSQTFVRGRQLPDCEVSPGQAVTGMAEWSVKRAELYLL